MLFLTFNSSCLLDHHVVLTDYSDYYYYIFHSFKSSDFLSKFSHDHVLIRCKNTGLERHLSILEGILLRLEKCNSFKITK